MQQEGSKFITGTTQSPCYHHKRTIRTGWYVYKNGSIERKEQIHGKWTEGNARKIFRDKSEVRRGGRGKATASNDGSQPQECYEEIKNFA